MTDDPQTGANPQAGSGLVIPDGTQQKFGELIELVKGSESMNDEERQYWVNILPVMTSEQRENLKEILDSERQQLAAIDAKYSSEIASLGEKKVLEDAERARRERAKRRESGERKEREEKEKHEKEVLEKIQNL